MSFITKVELVAALKEIDDEAKFLPLYLEGHALAIYLEMDETERQDPAKIKNRLKEAFCDGPFVAYAKLSSMKWAGEEVDVYVNEIRRLAGLARFEGPSLKHSVKLTFINGREGRGLLRHHRRGLGASGANVLNAGGPTWCDIVRSRPQKQYSVIAVGGKDTLLCTAVRGRGRETSRGKLLRQQLSFPKSKGAYRPARN